VFVPLHVGVMSQLYARMYTGAWYCAFRLFNKRIHWSVGHDMDDQIS